MCNCHCTESSRNYCLKQWCRSSAHHSFSINQWVKGNKDWWCFCKSITCHVLFPMLNTSVPGRCQAICTVRLPSHGRNYGLLGDTMTGFTCNSIEISLTYRGLNKRHFQMHFLERKAPYFCSIFTQVFFPVSLIENKLPLVRPGNDLTQNMRQDRWYLVIRGYPAKRALSAMRKHGG